MQPDAPGALDCSSLEPWPFPLQLVQLPTRHIYYKLLHKADLILACPPCRLVTLGPDLHAHSHGMCSPGQTCAAVTSSSPVPWDVCSGTIQWHCTPSVTPPWPSLRLRPRGSQNAHLPLLWHLQGSYIPPRSLWASAEQKNLLYPGH